MIFCLESQFTRLDPRHFCKQAESAVNDVDTETILRESHSLKGACLEFGAERMARYCEALASAVKHGNMDETANVMQKLRNEFARIRPVFDSVRSSLH